MQNNISSPRGFIFAFLAVLMCLAAFLRVQGVSVYHYTPDDLNHIEMAEGQSARQVLQYSLFEAHPPLGNLLRHYWMQLSDSPLWMRGLSLIFGLALIPLYYIIGAQLGGRWAGMCSAALAGFSYGCILQSFVVRNYTIYLFFLSSCVYAYLHWQANPCLKKLLAYTALGTLAVLTHFSAIFAVFSIACCECFRLLYRRETVRLIAQWGMANLFIAGVAAIVLYFWYPLLRAVYIPPDALRDWFYPLLAMNYLFFYHASSSYLFIFFTLMLYGLFAAGRNIPSARPYILLAVFALALGYGLVLSGAYVAGMTRHSLWLFPFLAPTLACGLSVLCGQLNRFLPDIAVAGFLLIAGLALDNPMQRFKDVQEYLIKETVWEDYTHFLKGLDASHLIIAPTTNDAFLTGYPDAQNLYSFYYPPHFGARGVFKESTYPNALLRYHDAWFVFKPYYSISTADDLVAMASEAVAEPQLQGIKTLVFISSIWSRPGSLSLALCTALDKKIVTLPALPAGVLPDKQVPTVILLISKQDFLHELLAPDGKAHDCLKPQAIN